MHPCKQSYVCFGEVIRGNAEQIVVRRESEMGKATTYDWIIIGAGFTGATLAERLAEGCSQRVLVIDRRPHIGGNAYDEPDKNGLLVHRYGPHIFHTNSQKVWNYLSRFTRWRLYSHHVLGVIDGHMVPIPFNL